MIKTLKTGKMTESLVIAGVKIQVVDHDDYFAYSARDGFFRVEKVPTFSEQEIMISNEQLFTELPISSMSIEALDPQQTQ